MMTVIVAGVSGSGKSTVGELLAERLDWQFIDGDSLHPAANIAKMARGEPLTDADRAPWLRRIGERIDAEEEAGRHSVVACSALKRRYRTELLRGRPDAWMAFLMIDYEAACERLAARVVGVGRIEDCADAVVVLARIEARAASFADTRDPVVHIIAFRD